MKERITTFLRTALKLTLSAAKKADDACPLWAKQGFCYEIGIMHRPDKFDNQRRRVVNGKVGLYIPEDVMHTKRKRYLRDEKPIHRRVFLPLVASEYVIFAVVQDQGDVSASHP